jgi:signal transduction histidine kinase
MKRLSSQLLFFILLSVNVFSQNRIDSLKHFYSLQISENERSKLISVNVLRPLSRIESDSLIYFAEQNYLLAKKTKNLEAISNATLSLGTAYWKSKNDAVALQHYYTALKGFEEVENKHRIAVCYMSISYTYKTLEDYKKSFDFSSKSLQIKESINNKDRTYYSALIHHANAAKELKDYKTAFKSSNVSFEYYKNEPYMRLFVENNKGFYFNELFKEPKVDSIIKELNIDKKQSLLDSALYFYTRTLETSTKIKNRQHAAYGSFGIGENAFLRKNYKKAIRYYKESNLISFELNNKSLDLLKRCYYGLYLSFSAIGDNKKALTNYKKFIEHRDKIQSDENKRALFKQDLVYKHEKELKIKEDKIAAKNRFIIIVSVGFIVALIILYLLIKRERLLREKKLQKQFSQNLLVTQEEERKRISEDLHDGLGQSLLLVKNQLTIKNYDKSKELLTDSIEEMRSIVKTLYPFQLSRVGISIALENLIIQLDENYKNMDFIYEIEEMKNQLTIQQETNIFRIVQECLSNSIKHAHADSVKVTLTFKDGKVNIQIQDNGRGFDIDQKNKELKTLGLKTIKERVDLLNGTLKIDSVKNSGTSFTIKFSIAA